MSPSCDIFNICTDDKIRGEPGYFKNIDDILTTAIDMNQHICRSKNMKLNPKKFQLGTKIKF